MSRKLPRMSLALFYLVPLMALADNTVKLIVTFKVDRVEPGEEKMILCSVPVVFRYDSSETPYSAYTDCKTGEADYNLPPGVGDLRVHYTQSLTDPNDGHRYKVVLKSIKKVMVDLTLPGPKTLEGLRLYRTDLPSIVSSGGTEKLLPARHVSIVLARYDLPMPPQDAAPQSPVQPRPQTMSLKVVDSKSKLTMESAKVSIQDAKTGDDLPGANVSGSGESGFQLAVPAGQTALVTFDAPGYEPRTFVLTTVGRSPALFDAEGKPALDQEQVTLVKSTASASPLDVVQTSRDENFSPELIPLLPLLLPRNLDHILELSPGVANAPQSSGRPGPALSPSIGTPGSFTVNGLRSRQNDFTFDGSDINDEETGSRRQGFSAPYPEPIESLTSLYMITAVGDARYGRSLGGHIDALSRTGGPKVHGQIYGFAAGGPLRARNFFDLSPNGYAPGMSLIPVTGDGTLTGTTAKFLSDSSYTGPLVPKNGYLYQDNPLETPPSDNRYQFGFNLGGSFDEKTHFFISGERQAQDSRVQSNFSVPTIRQRGNLNNGDTGFGSLYPTTLAGDAIYSIIPLPNNPIGPYGANTYTAVLPARSSGYSYSAKIDRGFQWGVDHNVSLRWNQTRDTTDLPSVGDAIYSSIQPITITTNLASFLTSRINSHMFNTFRFSIGFTAVHFDPIADPLLPSSQITSGPDAPFLLNAPLLIDASSGSPVYETGPQYFGNNYGTQAEQVTGPVGQIAIGGFSTVGLDSYHYPQHRNDDTVQFADTFSWTLEKHILYAGFDTRSIHLNTFVDRNARPLIEFDGERNGQEPQQLISPVELAAAGVPAAVLRTLATGKNESPLDLSQRQLEFFGQDYYRLRPNLTLNAGLRVELTRLPEGGRGVTGLNGPILPGELALAVQNCRNRLFYALIQQCQNFVNDLSTAVPTDLGQVFNVGLNSRSGRAGVAWDPMSDGKTVVRAGAGLYNGVFPFDLIDESRSAFDGFLPLDTPSFPFTSTGGSVIGLNTLGGATSNLPLTFLALNDFGLVPVKVANLGNSYSFQSVFSVERQLDSRTTIGAAYVGTMGRHLLNASTPAGGPLSTLVYIAGSPFSMQIPTFFTSSGSGDLTPGLRQDGVYPLVYNDGGSSTYHSLQLEVTRRQTRSLNLRVSYTWSHSIDNASDYYDSVGTPALPQSSVSPSERGDSSFDVRDRLAGYAIYTPPFSANNKFLGGWQVVASGIVQSGLPYTITSEYDINGDGNLTDRLDQTTNLKFHPYPGNPRIQVITTTTDLSSFFKQYVVNPDNVSDIYPQNLDGSVGRNTFRSLGLVNLDIALTKRGSLARLGAFELRIEGFNILNHANFAIPVHVLEAQGFGTSVSTVGTSRIFQVGVKKYF